MEHRASFFSGNHHLHEAESDQSPFDCLETRRLPKEAISPSLVAFLLVLDATAAIVGLTPEGLRELMSCPLLRASVQLAPNPGTWRR